MPIKKIPNYVSVRSGPTLSVISHSKKSHFESESRLFQDLDVAIRRVNYNYTVYLSTYPTVAVHIDFGFLDELMKRQDKMEEVVRKILEEHLKQT